MGSVPVLSGSEPVYGTKKYASCSNRLYTAQFHEYAFFMIHENL